MLEITITEKDLQTHKFAFVTYGLPGSGKTTCIQKIQEYIVVINICTDTILCKNPKISYKEIRKVKEDNMREAANNGFNVAFSDCNINPNSIAHISSLCTELGYKLIVLDFTKGFVLSFLWDNNSSTHIPESPVDLNEAIRRNSLRDMVKPKEHILKMWHKFMYRQFDTSDGKTIVCDIDGTIAHQNGRDPLDETKYDEDEIDKVLQQILITLHKQDYNIVFISGRNGTTAGYLNTYKWLSRHFDFSYRLFLRQESDKREDYVIKRELMLDKIGLSKVFCVFEDRPTVVRMWKEMGIKVFDCFGGLYEF